MSGFLDSKTRVMDTVVTLQGRKQLTMGGLSVAYATFTDSTVFYLPDAVSGSADATSRIYLEASSLPQDLVTLEVDDSGKLVPLVPSTGSLDSPYVIAAGQILSGSSVGGYESVSDSVFASQLEKLADTTLTNFQNLYTIGTRDEMFEVEPNRFGLSRSDVTFTLTDKVPVPDPECHSVNLNDLDSFFCDPRFSRLPNFRFLPPLRTSVPAGVTRTVRGTSSYSSYMTTRHRGTKPTPVWLKLIRSFSSSVRTQAGVPESCLLGKYSPLSTTKVLSDQAILSGLRHYEKMGYRVDVDFVPRPMTNSLLCQVFEQSGNTLLKLDVMDFGRVTLENGQVGNVYFVGKIETDDHGTNTFIHLFTMVFESYPPAVKLSKAQSRMRQSVR